MPTIDFQVHCYERNHPGRPWVEVLAGPPEVTGADMVKAMDELGVDGALLTSVFAMYRYDASYALAVHAAHPGRFGLVKPVDPNDPAVTDTIADWATIDGTVAVRIMMNPSVSTDAADPGINRVLAAAARHDLPVNLMCRGRLEQVGLLANRNPDTTLVVDHLGLHQPFTPPAPPQPWAELPKLLALAHPQEHRGQDQRRLHALAREVSLQGHLGSARPHLRRLRPRSLHVGHRLDARRRLADLQAGRRGVSRHRAPVRQRPGHPHGRSFAEGLRLGAFEGMNPVYRAS